MKLSKKPRCDRYFVGWLTILRELKTLTSFTNHWQKAGAIHSLAWIPQSIQMIFLWLLDGRLIWREHLCFITKQSLIIVSHCAKLSGFLFPLLTPLCDCKSEMRMLAEIPTNMTLPDPSSATFAPLLVTWGVILRTTCSLPMSPTQSLVGRLEIGLSPWLGYYPTVWPCTTYFASLGLGSLNHKMKEPKTEGCLWFLILFMENKVFKKNNTYFFKTENTHEKWTGSGVCIRVFSLMQPLLSQYCESLEAPRAS